jgi:hypothetical protein
VNDTEVHSEANQLKWSYWWICSIGPIHLCYWKLYLQPVCAPFDMRKKSHW